MFTITHEVRRKFLTLTVAVVLAATAIASPVLLDDIVGTNTTSSVQAGDHETGGG